MIGGVLRVLVAAALGAAVAGSYVISGYLSRLEGGIEVNERAAQRIVEAQEAIRKQNEVLPQMVQITERIGAGLDRVVSSSQEIRGHAQAIQEANAKTLELNGVLEANNGAAAQDLVRVVEALKAMNSSTAAVQGYLRSLRDTAADDVDILEAIAVNTARMNARTPGW